MNPNNKINELISIFRAIVRILCDVQTGVEVDNFVGKSERKKENLKFHYSLDFGNGFVN